MWFKTQSRVEERQETCTRGLSGILLDLYSQIQQTGTLSCDSNKIRSNNNIISCFLQGHKGLPGEPGKDGEPGQKVCVSVTDHTHGKRLIPRTTCM